MIQIQNLTVRNFMSVGNATQAVNFDRQDLTQQQEDIKGFADAVAALEHIDIDAEVQSHRDLEEEANYIEETYIKQYGLREMALIPNKRSALEEDMAPGDVKFESVDQIVMDQITRIESDFYDPKLLMQIYQTL